MTVVSLPVDTIEELRPFDALTLLGESLELLIHLTGDVPPSPVPLAPTDLQMSDMQLEKRKLASATPMPAPIDGVRLKMPSYLGTTPFYEQHDAITRKFYSKNVPPISIMEYLTRLHQFCPMSTAVYLATSYYIHRVAVEERAIPVTNRTAHRLVLAGLRVAMKALEDQSYPHHKVARVGGVSEAELARLEISFCFLAGFELVVGEYTLQKHYEALKRENAEVAVTRLQPGELRLERSAEVAA